MIISRPTHVALNGNTSFFLWLSNIPLCVWIFHIYIYEFHIYIYVDISYIYIGNSYIYICCNFKYVYTHTHTPTPHLLWPFTSWTFGLFPCLGYCKQCCYEHGYMYLFELEFSSFSYLCPGVGLLDHLISLFLVF